MHPPRGTVDPQDHPTRPGTDRGQRNDKDTTMAISLDDHVASSRPPVVRAAGFGQVVEGMVILKEVRPRLKRDKTPILKADGRPSKEEVLTVMVMADTTGVVSSGGLDDDRTPAAGEVARIIVKGAGYKQLIDARKAGTGDKTDVGNVIRIEAHTAVIWEGEGKIIPGMERVTDETLVAKARAKGHSVGWNTTTTFRPARPDEAALVTRAEALHAEQKKRISLDEAITSSGAADFDEEPF